MHSLIEILNVRGAQFLRVAWPMLWQSSLLIALLFALDFAARKKARATVRYVLWMLVLVKLVLPVSLSLPTSVGYWVPVPESLAMEEAMAPPVLTDMRYAQPTTPPIASRLPRRVAAVPGIIPLPAVTWPGIIAVSWLCCFVVLSGVFLLRARQARRIAARAVATDDFSELLAACARKIGVRSRVSLKLSDAVDTPAVCGLFRPVVLLPSALVGKLDKPQLQAVLLHELAHVRRGDLWVGHWQTALQIFYFYNPLLWLANAAIRRVREEAVDELVLVAMAEEAAVYPETLLNVAKFSLQAPRLAFGFAGILEKRSTLGMRIRLMLQRPWPTSAKLGVPGAVALLILGLILLPMGYARKMPSYQGKTAEQWLNQLGFSHDKNDKEFVDGIDAFTHMGKSAVPYLRQVLALTNAGINVGDPQSPLLSRGQRGGIAQTTAGKSKRDKIKRTIIRNQAAWVLKELGPVAAPAVPELISVLKDGNDAVASYAAMALGEIGPKATAATPALLDALKLGNGSAADALVKIDPNNPALVPTLIDVLNNSDPAGRGQPTVEEAAQALQKLGPRAAAAIPALRNMLADTNGPTQPKDAPYFAARALARIAADQPEVMKEINGALHPPPGPLPDIDQLITAAEKAAGTEQYGMGLQNLGFAMGEWRGRGSPVPDNIIKERVLPLFSKALDTSDSALFGSACGGLTAVGPVAAPLLPKIMAFFDTDTSGARINAVNAVMSIAPTAPATMDLLIRLLNEELPPLRQNACAGLAKFGPEAIAAVPALHKCLDDKKMWTRFNASLALWRIAKEPPSITLLQEVLNEDENGDFVPLRALEMLGGLKVQTDETKSIIRQLAQSSNEEARTNAVALLEKIGEKKNAL